MKIITDLQTTILEPTAVTVGFFDGVHLGHQYLINRLQKKAKERGLQTVVITFAMHPREVLQADYIPELLTTTNERVALLEKAGIDICVVLPFSKELAKLTSQEFMVQVLQKIVHARYLLVGHDHRFGSDRHHDVLDYMRIGKEIGMEVEGDQALVEDDISISSSVIRRALSNGDIVHANHYLGHPYFLQGTVVGGKQIGRTIGFPTANIAVNDQRKLIPADGVYATKVSIKEKTYWGMMNIGTRPTIEDSLKKTIEVHILDFNASIYQELISIEFIDFLRHEMKFQSLEELVTQLVRDKAHTIDVFSAIEKD